MAMHYGALNCAFQLPVADPGVLDDYEEGTWTPQIVGATSTGSTTYDFRSASYVKIGRVVFFNFNVAWTAATGTGDIQIAGLPFVAGETVAGLSLYVNNLAYTAGAHLEGFVAPGASIFLRQAVAGGSANGIPMTTGQVAGSGFFYV